MDKSNNVNEVWDKKKIGIALFMFVLLAAFAYLFKDSVVGFLREKSSGVVKGTRSSNPKTERNFSQSSKTNPLPLQTAIVEKINNLKKDVSNLSIEEIASSSPQIQRIINDFNSLKEYPVNQAQEVCRKICGL